MFMYDTIQRTIVAWAFNHYIAYYYFDNVNVNQLKVAFERGEVELEGLPIKKDALQHLNLPMEVVEGFVGRLSIKVPLMSLLTDPWVIKLTDLMLIVTPLKQTKVNETNDSSFANQSDIFGENDLQPDDGTEEAKLAEFYTTFSTSVTSMVRNIYKNIRLEIESVTILFEEFNHGLAKLSLDHLLLHRPTSVRKLALDNVILFLSSNKKDGDDLLRACIEKGNFNIHDEASHSMQLIAIVGKSESKCPETSNKSNSEIKCEGTLRNIIIDELVNPVLKSGHSFNSTNYKINEAVPLSKRSVMNCDCIKMDFKLFNNSDTKAENSTEKNLQIKVDLAGLQYIHSQRIFDIIKKSLESIPSYVMKLHSKSSQSTNGARKIARSRADTSNTDTNRLLTINIEDGLVYVIDDLVGSCATPMLEISLEDCRILQFSGPHQNNGFLFAKIGCHYYNRQLSVWSELLKPWQFNTTWDMKSSIIDTSTNNRTMQAKHRSISVNSDEIADLILTSAFLDLCDVALKRVFLEFINPKLWPVSRNLYQIYRSPSYELDSIFVLLNATGHRIFLAPLEVNNGANYEVRDSTDCGDILGRELTNRIYIGNQSSDLIDFNLANWITVETGDSLPFHYETLPMYRRHLSDSIAKSRLVLVRVEGWKTLLPISIDRPGLYFREACSDRVANEDTHIAISIDVETTSARKIITIRSPLNLVNSLDATIEIHFEESNQALYIKPDSQLSVPLPYLYNKMHIRPCNVGVTMSRQVLSWDKIVNSSDAESRLHICNPITITNHKHASYSTSQAFRVCVSTQRCNQVSEEIMKEVIIRNPVPVFTMSFQSPLTIINLLPIELEYTIGSIRGAIGMGCQQRVNYIDTTTPNDLHFKTDGFPRSRAINIDPGATGSFYQTIEMFDKRNRSLYLRAKIILASRGEEPAVQVIVYAPYWLINKTGLPLVFKQEGAALEAAGQFNEHEQTAKSTLLFSFYEIELEHPWLCSMRLGKSEGLSPWCEGFKLEKGSGERRLQYLRKSKTMKHLIDIAVRKGCGRYSETIIVTFSVRYGFDPLTKTPRKPPVPSPHNYKLTSFNHSTNLSDRIAGQAADLFSHYYNKAPSDINLKMGGFKLTLADDLNDKILEASVGDILVTCHTKAKEQVIDCSVKDIKIENVLSDCETTVMLDRDQSSVSLEDRPALRVIVDRILGTSFGTILFKQVQITTCELILNIEEKLILKLVEFLSFRSRRHCHSTGPQVGLSHELERNLNNDADRRSKYYFDLLRIDLSSLQLSVLTSSNLSDSLMKLKSHLGLKFFSFEDAKLQLAPYFKMNVSRTFSGVFESVTRFYKQQLLEQAPRIVGQQIQNYLRFHLSDLLSALYDEVYHKLFN